jgi:hypothetical protein
MKMSDEQEDQEELVFNPLDRKIERINVLRSLMGASFLDSSDDELSQLVAEEVNAEIRDFIVSLLNVELGIKPVADLAESVSTLLTPEKAQALDWLLQRITALANNPASVAPPAPFVAPVPNVAPSVDAPPTSNVESIHSPLPPQRGVARSRGSERGSGILGILKGENPDLITPMDPEFPNLTPEQRSAATRNFQQAVKNVEERARKEVESKK